MARGAVAAEQPGVVAALKAALGAANRSYYQTPMRFLTLADCNTTDRLQEVLRSGFWQPFMKTDDDEWIDVHDIEATTGTSADNDRARHSGEP